MALVQLEDKFNVRLIDPTNKPMMFKPYSLKEIECHENAVIDFINNVARFDPDKMGDGYSIQITQKLIRRE